MLIKSNGNCGSNCPEEKKIKSMRGIALIHAKKQYGMKEKE
jgi:hypothetical protein